MNFRKFSRLAAAIGLIVSLVSSTAAAQASSFTLSGESISSLRAAADQFRQSGSAAGVRVDVSLGDRVINVTFRPHDIRSADFRSETESKGGLAADEARVDLFNGVIEGGEARDFARLSLAYANAFAAPEISGLVRFENETYQLDSIQQAAAASLNNTARAEISVKKSGAESLHQTCLTGRKHQRGDARASAAAAGPAALSDELQIEIATEADYEFTAKYGGQAGANAKIVSILNGVDAIYRSDLGLTLKLTYQHAWAVPKKNPYISRSANSLLNALTRDWNTYKRGIVPYDIAHLFSGKTLRRSGATGVAWVGAVCTDHAYGVSIQTRDGGNSDTAVTAHEIGHNFSAQHDLGTGFIMTKNIVPNLTQFSPLSKAAISNYTYGSLLPRDPQCLSHDGGMSYPQAAAPVAPALPKAVKSRKYISVRWKKVVGTRFYRIYRSDASGAQGTLVGETNKTSFQDLSADLTKTYYYSVTTVFGTQESAPSPQDPA